MPLSKRKKIAVVGAGYVGLSLAVVMAQSHDVWVADISQRKLDSINKGISPISDPLINDYLSSSAAQISCTMDLEAACKGAEFAVIATPTDYDDERGYFDVSSVEATAKRITSYAPEAAIVVKSTVPVGYGRLLLSQLKIINPRARLLVSPEFLREGWAVYDIVHPSRIIIGLTEETVQQQEAANSLKELLINCSSDREAEVLMMPSSEAEAIKLFSNTYLAMRIAFFNELDSFAEAHDLSTEKIISGTCLDPRIGDYYNNPSFGYGGYCLPKDTKQLLANYSDIPNNIISAVVAANVSRKDFIASQVMMRKPKVVGIYRLAMKEGSDNFRNSSVLGVMERIHAEGVKVIVYEPNFNGDEFFDSDVVSNLSDFKDISDVILANRMHYELSDVKDKVYTRDVFCEL